jgi:hypothetical protein
MPSCEVGGVYRIRTILVKPPKEKIVLYVGDGFFLWFNTRARQQPGQLRVLPGECPEISHECYLDCGRVTVFSDAEVSAARHCGIAAIDFLTKVVDEIESRATVMVGLHRKAVAANLRLKHPDIPCAAKGPVGAFILKWSFQGSIYSK